MNSYTESVMKEVAGFFGDNYEDYEKAKKMLWNFGRYLEERKLASYNYLASFLSKHKESHEKRKRNRIPNSIGILENDIETEMERKSKDMNMKNFRRREQEQRRRFRYRPGESIFG